jgi:hypothetical protein
MAPGKVSRKADFIPPLTTAVEEVRLPIAFFRPPFDSSRLPALPASFVF